MFLGDFFHEEPGALNYLCNISANDIDHVSVTQLKAIINSRNSLSLLPAKCHHDDSPTTDQDVPGWNNKTPRKMWYPESNTSDPAPYKPDFDIDAWNQQCHDLDLPLLPACIDDLPDLAVDFVPSSDPGSIHPLFIACDSVGLPLKCCCTV